MKKKHGLLKKKGLYSRISCLKKSSIFHWYNKLLVYKDYSLKKEKIKPEPYTLLLFKHKCFMLNLLKKCKLTRLDYPMFNHT